MPSPGRAGGHARAEGHRWGPDWRRGACDEPLPRAEGRRRRLEWGV